VTLANRWSLLTVGLCLQVEIHLR